jgi:hypothetical protein
MGYSVSNEYLGKGLEGSKIGLIEEISWNIPGRLRKPTNNSQHIRCPTNIETENLGATSRMLTL